jgi:phage portal protein BeeE
MADEPRPRRLHCWEEFAKQLFWDYQAAGEAFVLATARYTTGWPARFHVVPPWAVDVEMTSSGTRRYSIGRVDVTADMLHIRYQGSVGDAHGHGPLEAGRARLVADEVLGRYVSRFAASGGVPTSILQHPEELTAAQAAALQSQWVQARSSSIGEPAVLSGGVTWQADAGSHPGHGAGRALPADRVTDRGAARRPPVPRRAAVRWGLDDLQQRHRRCSTITGAPGCGRRPKP